MIENFRRKLRKLKGKKQQKKTEDLVFPFIMHRRLLDYSARFEALVPDDPARIRALCGEENWWTTIIQSLAPTDCFWDIGSFTGLLTVFAAQRCPLGQVVSIEPEPGFYQRILRNVALNNLDNVVPYNFGISNEPGTLRLNTSGVAGWAPSFYAKGLSEWIEVPVTTIDLLSKERPDLSPTMMKIDVEGFEAQVIQGGSNTIKNPKLRVIYLEIHPKILYDNKQPVGEILTSIEKAGFRLKEFMARKGETHILALRD